MTLPTTGALSLNTIHNELGDGRSLQGYAGKTYYKDDGSTVTIPQAPRIGDFHGLRKTAPIFKHTISWANLVEVSLIHWLIQNTGYNGELKVEVTLENTTVLSENRGVPALSIRPATLGPVTDVKLILKNGSAIIGMGGTGGDGGTTGAAANGTPGGTALRIRDCAVELRESGSTSYIWGGGGGGGGGGGVYYPPANALVGGGGGGGGASYQAFPRASGGQGGKHDGGSRDGEDGKEGYSAASGTGGRGGVQGSLYGGNGGSGGGFGAGGSGGSLGGGGGAVMIQHPRGSGGRGGYAIDGQSFLVAVDPGIHTMGAWV